MLIGSLRYVGCGCSAGTAWGGGGLRVGVPSLTPVPLGAMLSCRLWEQQRQL